MRTKLLVLVLWFIDELSSPKNQMWKSILFPTQYYSEGLEMYCPTRALALPVE